MIHNRICNRCLKQSKEAKNTIRLASLLREAVGKHYVIRTEEEYAIKRTRGGNVREVHHPIIEVFDKKHFDPDRPLASFSIT